MELIHCEQVRVDYRHVRFVALDVINILIGLDNGRTLCCSCAEGVNVNDAFAEAITAWEQANAVKPESPRPEPVRFTPSGNGWEPIYTAPRDGREILAWGRGWDELAFVRWNMDVLYWQERHDKGTVSEPSYWLPAASRPPFIRGDF